MGMRTVRLDNETEKLLQQIMRETGLSVSSALKKGLLALQDEISEQSDRTPYDIYRELDLGAGGYATASSTQTRRGVRASLRRKYGR